MALRLPLGGEARLRRPVLRVGVLHGEALLDFLNLNLLGRLNELRRVTLERRGDHLHHDFGDLGLLPRQRLDKLQRHRNTRCE